MSPSIIRSDIKMTTKTPLHRETGSCFDMTDTGRILARPGAHERANGAIEVSAFSLSRTTLKPTTSRFLKKGTGLGGTLVKRQGGGAEEQEFASSPPARRGSRKGAYSVRKNPPNTEFRRFYERGDLPIQLDHGGVRNRLAWKVEIPKLDFHHYLPIFFDGLRETEQPYTFLAEQGVKDMLRAGWMKVLPVIPQLIIPIKCALNTRDPVVICKAVKILQVLTLCDVEKEGTTPLIGQALVPYYRQILPIFNLFIRKNANLGDAIEFGQKDRVNMGDLMMETLELFERYGGEDAFINIKYLVPVYQSAVIS